MARGPRGLVGRRKKQLEAQAAISTTLRGARKASRAVDSYMQNMSLLDAVLWGSGSIGPKAIISSASKARKVFNLLRRKKPTAKPAKSPSTEAPKVWLRGPGGKPKYSRAWDKSGKLIEKSGDKKPGGSHRLKDLPAIKPKKTTLSGRPGAIKKNGKHSGGLERYVDLSQWSGRRGNWRGSN
jgi:hypothetical protein|tara:strand:+ start:144 stop:689 length:546 start_codon:yes stop_codon:yes gene_type:complete